MVRFGVAGYPPAFNRSPYRKDRVRILEWLRDLQLTALELQMTYGPRTTPERCGEYRVLAEELSISLSVHASYYIVLTSSDKDKIQRSQDTLKRTFELCSILGARVLVLHPGPLYGEAPEEVQARLVDNLGECLRQIGPTGIGLFVETAGKVGQLGSVDEILAIASALDGVHPCIDFGHVHARTRGGLRSTSSIDVLVSRVTSHLDSVPNARAHFHYTPIDFGPRGERQHKSLSDELESQLQQSLLPSSDGSGLPELYLPRPEPVAAALRNLKHDFTIISETHNSQEEGALALKHAFSRDVP